MEKKISTLYRNDYETTMFRRAMLKNDFVPCRVRKLYEIVFEMNMVRQAFSVLCGKELFTSILLFSYPLP